MFFMRESQPSSDFEETKKKAEAGDAAAQYKLGYMYYNGQGAPMDAAEAARWYQKAADQGYSTAQRRLGEMYANGEDAPMDDAEAAKWFRKAADQGDAIAQFWLGLFHCYGRSLLKNAEEAYVWYNLAAISIDDARKSRDALELTPEQKARAQQRSTELHMEIEERKKAAGK